MITLDGGVLAVEIVRTSRQEVLDKAALRAVRDAVLFPKPPKRLFS
ncbi:MAG: TonB family protein [Desulfobacterales bacterium]|nr:TonB family protein [Desulfobacterales bacterium]